MSNKNSELIQSFKGLYFELKKSQFLMSNKIIVKILKFIATNEELKFVINHANQNYSFTEIYKEAVGSGRIIMPSEDYKVIVLVTGILFNIDRKNIDYLSFLKTYFTANNIADSFSEFCERIVLPYFIAFENVLTEDKKVLNIENTQKQVNMPKQLASSLVENILSISDQIVSDKTLTDTKRNEIFAILEGVHYCIEIGNTILIKAMWLGLKYALMSTKSYTSQLKAFESELKNYNILD